VQTSNREDISRKTNKPTTNEQPQAETNDLALSPAEKKKRAVMKKISAIEALKVRVANGEQLELNQLKKIENEEDLRKELAQL
jgi:translation initiation factor 2A